MIYRRLELSLYALVVAVSVGMGALTERLDHRLQTNKLMSEVAHSNRSFAFGIEAAISELIAWTNGMAAVVAINPDIDQRQFSAAAARLGTDKAIVMNVSLATDGVVRHVFPLEGNSLLLGRNLRAIASQKVGVDLAQQSETPLLLGPLDLVQGTQEFIVRYAFSSAQASNESSPVNRRDMISIAVDSRLFFAKVAQDIGSDAVNTTVLREGDDTPIYGDQSTLVQQPIISTLMTQSGNWKIASTPASGWPRLSANAGFFAGIALLRAILVCAVLQFLFRTIRKKKAAERQLEMAIEALDDGFALFDSDDRLILTNQRYHEIYKTSGDFLVPGATFEEIIRGGVARGQYSDIGEKDEGWIEKRLLAHRLGGSSIEQRLDNDRWIRVVERRTEDGGTVGFRVDITELKLATETALAAERAKSELISVLSHELRAPLTIIIGYLSLMTEIRRHPVLEDLHNTIVSGASLAALGSVSKLVDNTESMALKSYRSAQQLISLVNHLLDFSMIEAGKMRLDVTDASVEEILRDIDHSFRETIEAKGLAFDVISTAAVVRADPIRVRQVLINLLSNALKFTEVGYIRVEAFVKPGAVLIQVQDTGSGIDRGVADKIFDRFEQGDSSSTRRAGGVGLGLAICKDLVEMMGGEINLQADGQLGCTFWFTVPLANLPAD